MNERTHFFIKIYLSRFILERVDVSVKDGWRDIYTQREDFFFPYLLPGARRVLTLATPPASSSETPLIGCVSLARQRLSAFCLNLTAWFSSRCFLPVTHLLYPSALFTNQNVTVCQSTRGHLERTENPCHMLYKNIEMSRD